MIEKAEGDLLSCQDVFKLGKYANLTIGDVIIRDPHYIQWALENIGGFKLDPKASALFSSKTRF